MQPRRLSVKLFITNPDAIDFEKIVKVFHGWIQDQKLPGLLIDVADYKHVPKGPHILLIGHEGDFNLDELDNGTAAFVYDYKRELTGTLADRLKVALERLVIAAVNFEAETGLQLDVSKIKIALIDRLQAPNNAETFKTAKPEIQTTVDAFFEGATATVEQVDNDPRQTAQTLVTLSDAPTLERLAAKITQTA